MSFGEFVTCLLLLLHRQKKNLALHDERGWNNLLYRLYKLPETSGKPAFFAELQFDWTGPDPRSRDLGEWFSTLRRTGSVEWSSPGFARYWIAKDIVPLWEAGYEGLGTDSKLFLESACRMAVEALCNSEAAA